MHAVNYSATRDTALFVTSKDSNLIPVGSPYTLQARENVYLYSVLPDLVAGYCVIVNRICRHRFSYLDRAIYRKTLASYSLTCNHRAE